MGNHLKYSIVAAAAVPPQHQLFVVSLETNVSIKWSFSAGFFELSQGFRWGVDFQKNIEVYVELSFEDAYYGKELQFSIERKLVNKHCLPEKCSYCNGTGRISSSQNNKYISKSLSCPCPHCKGSGIEPKPCDQHHNILEQLSMTIPPGCLSNYGIKFIGKGHEVYKLNNDEVGDLNIVVTKINTNNIIVTSTHVEILVLITPSEALEGFIKDISYLPNQQIHINRLDKITLPDSKVTIKNLGMPIALPLDASMTSNSSSIKKEYGDLIIKFALTPPISTENNGNATQEIRTQSELEDLLERNKAVSDDKSKRELLHMLKVIEKRKAKHPS